MRYVIKEKFWSWGDDFYIFDEKKRQRFFVDGKAFSWGDKLSVQDLDGKELAFISQKLLSWKPKYEIYREGRLFAEVIKEFSWFNKKFTLDVPGPNDYAIDGSFWRHEYEFTRGGRCVAVSQISRLVLFSVWRSPTPFCFPTRSTSGGTKVYVSLAYRIMVSAHTAMEPVRGPREDCFPPAKELLEEMDSIGMILDVTHASDESVRQELDLFSGPVLASHQNCRAIASGERQFPDDILKRIIDRGAVIGASMDTWMLYPVSRDWADKSVSRRSVFPREAVTLENLVDHIDHVCQLAGNSEHAAIGGDTDGQGGCEGAPIEIDTVADYQKVAGVLEERGYSDDDIANVMYRNWQRFFEKWLPE